jgi:hypothetical protein
MKLVCCKTSPISKQPTSSLAIRFLAKPIALCLVKLSRII